MSDKIIDTIATALDEHRPVRDPNGHINGTVPGSISVYDCWCDRFMCKTLPECLAHQSAATLAALRANNIAVVELPEPCDGPDGDGQLWFDDYAVRADPTGSLPQRRIVTDFGMGTEFKADLSPLRARCLALALLAAADAAERAA